MNDWAGWLIDQAHAEADAMRKRRGLPRWNWKARRSMTDQEIVEADQKFVTKVCVCNPTCQQTFSVPKGKYATKYAPGHKRTVPTQRAIQARDSAPTPINAPRDISLKQMPAFLRRELEACGQMIEALDGKADEARQRCNEMLAAKDLQVLRHEKLSVALIAVEAVQ